MSAPGDDISKFHFYFMEMFGPEQVTIYLHLLLNGIYIHILRKHRNLAVYDQNRVSSSCRRIKRKLQDALRITNLHDIARNQLLYYVMVFVLNIKKTRKIGLVMSNLM
jgi:hypothetical protein